MTKLTFFTRLLLAAITIAGSQSLYADDLYAQAGSHVIYSYPGLIPPDSLLELTRQGKVGGVILFKENVGANIADVVDSFQLSYAEGPAYSGSPLLIMTDQEGGLVRRLPGGPDQSAKVVGQSANPASTAFQTGLTASSVLEAAHVNTNLAPVVDVWRTTQNFLYTAGRSYSNDASVVSACASAFITAQQGANVVATAKHFPGLGAAGNENTDLQAVTINTSLTELRKTDLLPYWAAITAGVDMVMTSWAIYPALDSQKPAGMSRAWIQNELRGNLGFKGVTITDAIEAAALASFGNDAQRGLLASQAGMDLLLASGRNATQGEAIVEALVQALRAGTLNQTEFAQGTTRITNLRSKLQF